MGEDGNDEGGLTEEMHAAFWQGVVSPALGLFESAEGHPKPAFLPRPGACRHSLEMAGLMLCKSLVNRHPTGPGLARFAFDFLLEAEGKFNEAAEYQATMLMEAKSMYDKLKVDG